MLCRELAGKGTRQNWMRRLIDAKAKRRTEAAETRAARNATDDVADQQVRFQGAARGMTR